MGDFDRVLDTHGAYTSTKKQSKVDMKAMEDRWMNYNYRLWNNPELSPLLTKKEKPRER
jgi:hypothetical protein